MLIFYKVACLSDIVFARVYSVISLGKFFFVTRKKVDYLYCVRNNQKNTDIYFLHT